jgi:hypothetical protein
LIFFINSQQETPWFEFPSYIELVIGVVITTIGWILVTLFTSPTSEETLEKFNQLIFEGKSKFHNMNYKILAFLLGIIGIYSFLFATGNWIYGNVQIAIILSGLTLLSGFVLNRIWKKIS